MFDIAGIFQFFNFFFSHSFSLVAYFSECSYGALMLCASGRPLLIPMSDVSARLHFRSATRWFRDAGSAHSVHGPSLWPACRFGTLYQTTWEIRILAGTTLDVCWRRIHLHCIESFSALEMFHSDTLYKVTSLLTGQWYELIRSSDGQIQIMIWFKSWLNHT